MDVEALKDWKKMQEGGGGEVPPALIIRLAPVMDQSANPHPDIPITAPVSLPFGLHLAPEFASPEFPNSDFPINPLDPQTNDINQINQINPINQISLNPIDLHGHSITHGQMMGREDLGGCFSPQAFASAPLDAGDESSPSKRRCMSAETMDGGEGPFAGAPVLSSSLDESAMATMVASGATLSFIQSLTLNAPAMQSPPTASEGLSNSGGDPPDEDTQKDQETREPDWRSESMRRETVAEGGEPGPPAPLKEEKVADGVQAGEQKECQKGEQEQEQEQHIKEESQENQDIHERQENDVGKDMKDVEDVKDVRDVRDVRDVKYEVKVESKTPIPVFRTNAEQVMDLCIAGYPAVPPPPMYGHPLQFMPQFMPQFMMPPDLLPPADMPSGFDLGQVSGAPHEGQTQACAGEASAATVFPLATPMDMTGLSPPHLNSDSAQTLATLQLATHQPPLPSSVTSSGLNAGADPASPGPDQGTNDMGMSMTMSMSMGMGVCAGVPPMMSDTMSHAMSHVPQTSHTYGTDGFDQMHGQGLGDGAHMCVSLASTAAATPPSVYGMEMPDFAGGQGIHVGQGVQGLQGQGALGETPHEEGPFGAVGAQMSMQMVQEAPLQQNANLREPHPYWINQAQGLPLPTPGQEGAAKLAQTSPFSEGISEGTSEGTAAQAGDPASQEMPITSAALGSSQDFQNLRELQEIQGQQVLQGGQGAGPFEEANDDRPVEGAACSSGVCV